MGYISIAGIVASRAQWRFVIFKVGLQMAITLNHVKYSHANTRALFAYKLFRSLSLFS